MGGHPVVLVTGAGGQVGIALERHLPSATFAGRRDLDVTDRTAVTEAIRGVDVVVHLAALTDVDRCEREPELAHLVNATGTGNVAAAAAATGARLIYVSTDYVFDGRKSGEYAENDPVAPASVYGASKEVGEQHVRQVPRHLIVRTSWVFGEGRNFVRTIADLAKSRDTLDVVDDQRGRPTYAVDLAAAIAALVETEEEGILHVTGDGIPCSWADFAEEIVAAVGSETVVNRIDTPTFVASRSGPIAPRPENSVLALDKARGLGIPLSGWRDGLARYLGAAA